jgi:hypothetical protein
VLYAAREEGSEGSANHLITVVFLHEYRAKWRLSATTE